MPTYFPIRREPLNGVSRRPVPGPLAPEKCVTIGECVTRDQVQLVGRDLGGVVRVKVEISVDDLSVWWVKVIRHWLAWHYGASEIRIVS